MPDPLPAITIVTGLPRSGTSVLMSMLHAAGVPIVTDGRRAADASNPRGYWEDARVMSLPLDASWLAQCSGQAVKILIPLIRHIPLHLAANVLWIERSLDTVIASQAAMLQESGRTLALPLDRLRPLLEQQMADTRSHLAARPNFRLQSVSFERLVTQPIEIAGQVAEFLHLDPDKIFEMANCVDPSLWRQRPAI